MSVPKIDQRGTEEILKQFREMVPFYTPEWNPETKDPGWALTRIFAGMFAGVVNRLNQVPEKNFIEFLNMIGVKLLPVQQARAPVVFSLSSGAADPVLIPAGTQVAAEAADGGEPVVFETERNITATPAKLVKAFSVKPDSIFEVPEGLLDGQRAAQVSGLFCGQDIQEHILYLGNRDLLMVENEVEIELISSNWNLALIDKEMVRWEYYGVVTDDVNGKQEDWHLFEDWHLSTKEKNSYTQKIVLKKNKFGEITEKKINDVNNRWLRCVVKSIYIDKLKDVALETFKMAVKPLSEKESQYILPDMMFNNDIPIETPTAKITVYPFGRFPRVYDTFYLASSEALSKKNGIITLAFDAALRASSIPVGMVQGIGPQYSSQLINNKKDDHTPDPIDTLDKLLKRTPEELTKVLTRNRKDGTKKPISVIRAINILEAARKEYFDKTGVYQPGNGEVDIPLGEGLMLSWEYWNGTGWQVIKGLRDNTNKLRQTGTVVFKCPEDLTATVVSGQENQWIRTRIISGDYGKEQFISNDGQTWQTDTSQINPPAINSLKIQYDSVSVYPEKCLTVNNLNYVDITTEIHKGDMQIKPFIPLHDTHCTFYLGFDTPPLKGPISLFFSLKEQEYPEDNRPSFQWEYCRDQKGAGEWVSLEVLDGTSSLSESGCLEFVGPPDMACNLFFGKNLYWIRAVDVGDIFFGLCPARVPFLSGVYLNTAWASQSETAADELLGSSDGEGGQLFTCNKFPIISEEIWVNELNALSEGERKVIADVYPKKIKEIVDEKGSTSEFWIRWDPVDDFLDSGPVHRHYIIDRALGLIKFGDGTNGAIPPIGTDSIRAAYRAGGGARGNVGQGEITGLKTSIAFVDSVKNPEPADGGADTETLQEALERGPQILRHQNRAVTLDDFEWLARESSRNIARVKCLPNYNDRGENQSGWVTLVIVPKSTANKPQPSLRLRQQVEKRLKEQTAIVVAFPRHLRVIGPDYKEISIFTTVIAKSFDLIPLVENKVLKKIDSILHPLTGGSDGRGWEFGRFPHLSDLYAILEGVDGVDYVEELTMIIRDKSGLETKISSDNQMGQDMVSYMPHALVYSGKHTIRVKAKAGGIV